MRSRPRPLCPYVASMGVHGNMAPGSASPAASFETDVPLSDIQPNPYLPMPSTDEFMTECQALPSPRRWAALQAAKLLTAAPVTSTTTPAPMATQRLPLTLLHAPLWSAL